ncbi:YebC/PmpR family DNA-binding transcriptional regulator [Candidatus Falkowbacteria bacterium]|nr:MAG: YebC/PmpR family DNA-binding transcriptional regulator [Candidatus Falkowbacteria bacterium]
MSGHSKWSKIKRQKGVTDLKRGAEFTKLGNIIAIAAREKGGDPETNFSLRMAIDKARASNMPKDNIERSIKRGIGELEGGQIEEILYEGFGPGKAQFIVRALTDNKNRSAANIRHIFTKYGGALGSVMWNFEKQGVVRISNDEFRITNEETELELIEAGVQDINKEAEGITLITNMEDLVKVKKYLDDKGIKTESAEIEYMAKEEMELNEDDTEKIEKFVEALDENEDVADYYTNANF